MAASPSSSSAKTGSVGRLVPVQSPVSIRQQQQQQQPLFRQSDPPSSKKTMRQQGDVLSGRPKPGDIITEIRMTVGEEAKEKRQPKIPNPIVVTSVPKTNRPPSPSLPPLQQQQQQQQQRRRHHQHHQLQLQQLQDHNHQLKQQLDFSPDPQGGVRKGQIISRPREAPKRPNSSAGGGGSLEPVKRAQEKKPGLKPNLRLGQPIPATPPTPIQV